MCVYVCDEIHTTRVSIFVVVVVCVCVDVLICISHVCRMCLYVCVCVVVYDALSICFSC